MKYDLAERTAIFGEKTIEFCRGLKQDTISRPLIGQLVRSATSVGANYKEANAASSKKDFANKVFICKKETQETEHWLRMIIKAQPESRERSLWLTQECHELVLIFQKISSSSKTTKAS